MKGGDRLREDGGVSRLDRYLRTLGDERRRYLLYRLSDDPVTTVDELARQVAAQTADREPSEVSEEECDRMRATLHHEHLPRLRDYGIVDYDERSQDVRLVDRSQVLQMLLQVCRFVED
ncbi:MULTISPECIES: hypothetical protein [Halorussus]|uniref:DUF7344 domain-containing protein n=1 Tax=Halorussus TaxID=1070314 RepID=UPI000E21AA0C|nr:MULTISPECIES: hypothetical protein [Halorussus]NHN61054.1 hypothetical protein [Halorussus sp. JP-T4]